MKGQALCWHKPNNVAQHGPFACLLLGDVSTDAGPAGDQSELVIVIIWLVPENECLGAHACMHG